MTATRPLPHPREAAVTHDPITLIDEHTVVACPLDEAAAQLADPAAIAAWFGARNQADRTTVTAGATTLEFSRRHLDWQPDQHALIVDGTVDALRYHAHFTLRGAIRLRPQGTLYEATEIWAHLELAPAHAATTTAQAVQAVLCRGLEHLRLELDTEPEPTA